MQAGVFRQPLPADLQRQVLGATDHPPDLASGRAVEDTGRRQQRDANLSAVGDMKIVELPSIPTHLVVAPRFRRAAECVAMAQVECHIDRGLLFPIHIDVYPHSLIHREPHVGQAAPALAMQQLYLFVGFQRHQLFAHGAEGLQSLQSFHVGITVRVLHMSALHMSALRLDAPRGAAEERRADHERGKAQPLVCSWAQLRCFPACRTNRTGVMIMTVKHIYHS